MPVYVFECRDGHRREEVISIANRDTKIKCTECKKIAKRIIGGPTIVDPIKIMRNKGKLGSDFVARMKDIQKHHPGNTIKERWS